MDQSLRRIKKTGVIGILRGIDSEIAVDVAEAVVEGGVTAIEVTADTSDAIQIIETLSDSLDNVSVGAGTVLDSQTARSVQIAGAEFVVTPTVDEGVINTCNRYGIPIVSGAFTPTQVMSAYELGADLVKIFPAETGGHKHISSINSPLGHVPLVPTGGVQPTNAGKYINAGAVAVGAGSAIISEEAITNENYDGINRNAMRMIEAVESARR